MYSNHDRIDPALELSIARAVFKYYEDMKCFGNEDAYQKHHLQSILTAAIPPPVTTSMRKWLSMAKDSIWFYRKKQENQQGS